MVLSTSEPSKLRQRYASERLEHTQSGSGLFAEVPGTGTMDSIIYLIGLIVVVMFILSLLGLH